MTLSLGSINCPEWLTEHQKPVNFLDYRFATDQIRSDQSSHSVMSDSQESDTTERLL